MRNEASDSGSVPQSWPKAVTFLKTPRYSKKLSQEALLSLHNNTQETLPNPQSPNLQVTIREINDPDHPAHGQYGLFAAKHLAPDLFILPYIGLVHGPEDPDPLSDYDLCLDRTLNIGVDANKMGNEARFINDYRGIASSSNAEFRECWLDIAGRPEKRVGIFVLTSGKAGKRSKGIARGEEILVSYGKSFWATRDQQNQ